MRISILTLFPEMFAGPFDHSIIKRARLKNLVKIDLINLRDSATDKYKSVDDHPYGGGTGMILRVDVVDRALSKIKTDKSKTVLLDPRGKVFQQNLAKKLADLEHLILICGHYEGIDERIRKLADLEISIGDYVLTGGEIPAMAIVDSVVRLSSGVLKKSATIRESFTQNLLEYPQYTRPISYKNMKVPDILQSGNHLKIEEWRQQESNRLTKKLRPDLLK